MNRSTKNLSLTTEKKLRIGVWIVTALVLVLVGLMRRPDLRVILPDGVHLDFLPAVHAVLNSAVAVFLIAALVAVKNRNYLRHQRFMTTAVMLSVLFLLCYVAYHFTNEETKFGGEGTVRVIYFFLLITHIVAAAASFPLILLTYLAGWSDQRKRHRRLAKFTYPMWLYVAITGPVCYWMLRPYY
jgi:putative membrane protein